MSWRGWLVLLIACGLSACAATPTPQAQTDGEKLGLGPRPSGKALVREYLDTNKVDERTEERWVRLYWDYSRGVAVEERTSKSTGAMQSIDQPGMSLSATPTELERAFALVRGHPDLKATLDRTDIDFFGGFRLMEMDDPNCGAKTRCVHVIISGPPNGQTSVAHAIVDLMADRVVYPFYRAPQSSQTSSE
jgi:hypothetical protein